MAAVADLVHADRDQAVETVTVQPVSDDSLHDRGDGVSPNPEAGDRRLRHLLRQPRQHVLKVAGVVRPVGPTGPPLSYFLRKKSG